MRDLGSFSDPAVQRCPFALIDKLHAEAPIYLDPRTGFHVVSRNKDIAYISMNPQIFSNRTPIVMIENDMTPGGQAVAQRFRDKGIMRPHTIVTNDPPGHTIYRGLVDKVFTASFVKKLEPWIANLADELIDDFCEIGQVDLNSEFCIKLPMYVIVDQLGLPREDWRTFKFWSDALVGNINPGLAADERLRLADAHIEMQHFLLNRALQARQVPEDRLLGALANLKINGRFLDDGEFVSIAEQLFVAGNETTTSALGHAARLLILNPDVADRLRREPAKISTFTEEVLRLHAPSPHLYRQVTLDTEINGYILPKGSIVMLSYLAGNYDPESYDQPEKIDLDRPGVRNHLAFGRGIHYCLGNLLARSEIRHAVKRILDRLPNLRFDPDYPEPRFAEIFHVHALDSLHVRFDATPRRGDRAYGVAGQTFIGASVG